MGIMGDSHILVSVSGFDVPSACRVREVFRSSPHRPSPLPARSFCRLGLCVLQVLKALLTPSSRCSTSARTRRWWRCSAGIEPTGRWGGLVKSRCVSGAGGCVRYVRCLCLSLTDSYMPALVPCRTSCTLPARGLRPQGLDGRLGAAGGAEIGSGVLSAGSQVAQSSAAGGRCGVPGRPDIGGPGSCFVSLCTS